jgi:acyl-CoA thioester hydrolase
VESTDSFEYPIRVAQEDIDQMGHVNNAVYLKYAQEAAAAHWYRVVSEDLTKQMVWVVRRHEIEYLRPAFNNEELVVKTWVGETTAATWERFTEIYRLLDRQLLVQAKSIWVLLDAKTGRPRRIDDRLLLCFGKTK